MPKNDRDQVGHVVLVRKRDSRVGVIGSASAWRRRAELFKWNLSGDKLKTEFPQDRRRVTFGVRTWKCQAPKPFDLCMEISRKDRKARFYSRQDWKLDSDELPIELDAGDLLTVPDIFDEEYVELSDHEAAHELLP